MSGPEGREPGRSGGHHFEDFRVGMVLRHPAPRTIHGGDLSLYIALTGDRRPLNSSTEFAMSLGFQREVVHDLLAFHVVFGKSVGDISRHAVANLGYADVRFLRAVYPGDTLRAQSEVIGVREVSSGKAGVVWVTTHGFNQKDQEVLRFTRWVLVEKRDPAAPAPTAVVPVLPAAVSGRELPVPEELNLQRFDALEWATGGVRRFEDYAVGERVVHGGGVTIDESDHGLGTRLYQNTAHVHFDGHAMARSRFGRRLVYGGHVISVAHGLAHEGLENVLRIAAWNSGSHVAPTFAGDTIYAWSEVLDREPQVAPGLGALRLALVAVKDVDPAREKVELRTEPETYHPSVVLHLDYWALIPHRGRH
jgi:2-methylfumaryl-CoA hydratase